MYHKSSSLIWIIFSCLQDDTASNFIAFSGEGQSLRKKGRKPWLHTADLNTESQLLFGFFVLFLNYHILNMDRYLMTCIWISIRTSLMFLCTRQMMFYKNKWCFWRTESPLFHKLVTKHLFCNIYMHNLNYLNKDHPAIHQTDSLFTLGWVFNHFIPSALYLYVHILL